MSVQTKRTAQSPLSGDEDDLKRRNIMVDLPVPISLDDISEGEGEEAALESNSGLNAVLEEDI